MAEARVHTVRAQPLTARAWAPFGALPVDEGDPSDRVELEFQWVDAHVNYITHAPWEIERTARGLRCERMYRHDTHTQVLMPMNCEVVVTVAPPGVDFTGVDDLEAVRAFRLQPLECVVLHRGSWHWGPYPLGGEPVRLWNLQGRRYTEDNAAVDLASALDATIEVLS